MAAKRLPFRKMVWRNKDELTGKEKQSMNRFWLTAIVVLLVGCSGKLGRVVPPKIDASAAAAKAMEQFDRNGDGSLSAEELTACPALAYALPRYDTDHSHTLSKNEVEAGILRWAQAKVGARSLPFRVQFDGRALEGAQVKLTPESFLNGAIAPATGEAKRGGNGFLSVARQDLPHNAPNLPLVQPGLYRVEITHPSQKIPAKYNSASTLGLGVAVDSIAPDGVSWALTTSKN